MYMNYHHKADIFGVSFWGI